MPPITDRLGRIPRYFVVTISGWIARGIEALAQLAAIPIVLGYLGTDMYAVYAVVTALVVWFQLVEFGVGPTVQNLISESQGAAKDPAQILQASLVVIVGLLIIACAGWYWLYGPVSELLFRRLDPQAITGLGTVTAAAGYAFIITTVAATSYRVFFAQHEGYVANFCQAGARLLALGAIVAVTTFYDGEMKQGAAILAWVIPPACVSIAAFAYVYAGRSLRRAQLDLEVLKEILRRSAKFSVLPVMTAAVLHVDYLIMTQTLQPAEIAQYTILQKIYNFMLVLYWAMLAAMWPELSESFSKGDWPRATRLLRVQRYCATVSLITGTCLLVYGLPWVITHVLGKPEIEVAKPTVLLFGLLFLIRAWCDTYATALMSMSHVGIFWQYMPVQAIFGIALQYWLSLIYGLDGIVMGLTLSFGMTAAWILPRELRRVRMSRQQ